MNEELPLCECGCGWRVSKPGNKYIIGHSGGRGSKITPLPEPKLCGCGCGKYALSGNDYIKGHQNIGKKATPKTIAKMSDAKLGIPHTSDAQLAADEAKRGVPHTPEHNAAISAGKLGVPFTPEHCDAISEAKLGVPNPRISTAQIAADDAKRGVPNTPEHNAAIKKGQEDAGVFERQRGGNDIVGHHYIYDHSDLSLNIVKMTRSNHTSLHHLLKKLGYVVPHINTEEI